MSFLQHVDRFLKIHVLGLKSLVNTDEHQALRQAVMEHRVVRRQNFGNIGETSGTRWNAADFSLTPGEQEAKDDDDRGEEEKKEMKSRHDRFKKSQ